MKRFEDYLEQTPESIFLNTDLHCDDVRDHVVAVCCMLNDLTSTIESQQKQIDELKQLVNKKEHSHERKLVFVRCKSCNGTGYPKTCTRCHDKGGWYEETLDPNKECVCGACKAQRKELEK